MKNKIFYAMVGINVLGILLVIFRYVLAIVGNYTTDDRMNLFLFLCWVLNAFLCGINTERVFCKKNRKIVKFEKRK